MTHSEALATATAHGISLDAADVTGPDHDAQVDGMPAAQWFDAMLSE